MEAAQRVHTNDVMGAQPGQVRYGGFVDEDGMLVDDGTVFTFADDHLWVMHERRWTVPEYFADATKGLDVSIEYIAPELPSMQIQGPRSRDLLQGADRRRPRRAAVLPVPARAGAGRRRARLALAHRVQRRARLRGVPARPSTRSPSGTAIEGAGATPYGMDVIEPIRIEVGMIVTDYDYEAHERTPFDVGMDRFVALDALASYGQGPSSARSREDPPNRFKPSGWTRRAARLRYAAAHDRTAGTSGCSRARDEPGLRTDRPGDRAAPTWPPTGPPSRSVAGDGAIAGTVDVLSIYDPTKERPRG